MSAPTRRQSQSRGFSVVYRFDVSLFFNADRLRERVEQALSDNSSEEEWLVLDFEGVGALDATALDVLDELVARVDELGVRVVGVARANDWVLARLALAALLEPTDRYGCSRPSVPRGELCQVLGGVRRASTRWR